MQSNTSVVPAASLAQTLHAKASELTHRELTEKSGRVRHLGGRPEKHPWNSLKDELQVLIDKGWGLLRLAKKYNMSVAGMRRVLHRLNLRTVHQRKGDANGQA